MPVALKSKYFPDFVQGLPRVDGKVYVITGTTSGTGFIAAHTIANLGGTVLLLNRPSSRSESSLQKLKELAPDAKFVPIDCDLQDFNSVRQAATKIKQQFNSVDCIANNAGIFAVGDLATGDGYDVQMQTNHLSHFLLVKELFPLLQTAAAEHGEARVVNHSSVGRVYVKKLKEEYLGKNGGNLGGNGAAWNILWGANFKRYYHSKLANSVFTHAMEGRCLKTNPNIKSFSAHPGGSVTNIADHLNVGCVAKAYLDTLSLFLQTGEDGAMGLLQCMVDPTVERGQMYGPAKNRWRGRSVLVRARKSETDKDAQNMLWRMSEEAVGEFSI